MVPSQQFQALFNSLFKVLFIFPSQYLFAIGLPPVFSLRWNLPPALSCNPKQLDSVGRPSRGGLEAKTGLSPSLVPCSKGINPGPPPGTLGTTPRRDWQHGLFPLQSPLLRESLLVSFPPLNYMLKFGGSSCLIGDPERKRCYEVAALTGRPGACDPRIARPTLSSPAMSYEGVL